MGYIVKLAVVGVLSLATVTAVGGAFRGWFLPDTLEKPVSLRDGSPKARSSGLLPYFIMGRSHYGGGYRGGK